MNKDKSIVLPRPNKIITDTTSYWAAFYCSILKSIKYQKNLQYKWGENKSLQDYKGELKDKNFFGKMKNTVKNHAFEYVMVDFLRTTGGFSYFKELCKNILSDYQISDFEILYMNIFKVGTDSEIFNAKRNYNRSRLMMLLPNGVKAMPEDNIALPNKSGGEYRLSDSLQFSDLFVIISNGEETIGFVGEVEGNHGEELYKRSYFEKNKIKNMHCVFGVSVSDKKKHAGVSIKENVTLNRSEVVGRWILNFSESSSYIKDYHASIENLQGLVEGHFSYIDYIEDQGHLKILNTIKDFWKKDILDLISWLGDLVDFISPKNNFHYQDTVDGEVIYRPSALALPDQLPLYSIDEELNHVKNKFNKI